MMLDETTARYLRPPAAPPRPMPGCGRCAELDAERTQASAARDYSAVSDCNVKLRTHQHQ